MTDFSRLPPLLRNQFHKIRRRRLKEKQTFFALLGNGSGAVAVPDTKGKVWVRFQSSADADGNVTYTPPKDVNAGTNNYFEYDGSPVRVGFDDDGELEVKRSDAKKARDAGLDTRILNTGNPARKWLYLRNIVNFKSLAPGASTVVSVRSLLYDDNYGDLNLFEGTRRLADKIDLASYIPATGYHRVVCLFLDTVINEIKVYASTTQTIATDIVLEDYQECFAQRGAETIPIQAYILQNDQATISMLDSAEDLRQIFNMPQALGFPNPVNDNQIIRSGRSVTHAGDLTITGNLTILGDLTILDEDTRITSAGGTFGDVVAGDYSIFEDNGTLILNGTARVTKSVWLSATGINAPHANPASLVAHGLASAWQFANAIEVNQEHISALMKVPKDMDRSVAPDVCIGWSADGISPGDCEWQIEYLWTALDEDTTAAAQETLSVTGTASATSNGLVITATDIDAPSATDVCLHMKITRLSADGNDTIADDVEISGLAMVYTMDKLGEAL